ncbi:Hypothetical predicted protein, partial [Marmota monax]
YSDPNCLKTHENAAQLSCLPQSASKMRALLNGGLALPDSDPALPTVSPILRAMKMLPTFPARKNLCVMGWSPLMKDAG